MALTPGTRLGVYDIAAPIGEGGMGQVWRATDTSLGRQVAVKILPDAFAADPERLARFEREAKTLASLNHPHIAAIYGFEKSSGMHALVMELVEGEDLSQRIARGAIPFDEALPLARQIAEALEAAHEQGIIHRDLKPANIKVRDDGTVKVLDFGLAKAMEPGSGIGDPGSAQLANSPTITTPAMTMRGMILGTAAYMSPEQARGKVLDKRTDIWAFGAVLYEMLSGSRPFVGDDTTDVIAAVVKTTPDWSALPADVPRPIITLIQRCLEKDRKARVGDIAVARFLLADSAAGSPAEAGRHIANLAPPRAASSRALPIAAAVVLTAAIVGGLALGLRPAPVPPVAVAQFSIASPTGQQTRSIAISPDGRRLIYTEFGSAGLYLRAIGDVEAHLVPGTPPGLTPQSAAFSPDGESVVFYSTGDGSLKRIPVAGGQSLTLVQGIRQPSGVSWGEGGIVFGQEAAGVFRVSPDGGKPELLATVAAGEVAHGPQVLPGGQSVMFTVAGGSGSNGADRWDTAHIVVQSLTSGERRTIVSGGTDARYLPTGHVIYTVAGTVFAVAFDPNTQTVRGDPVAVVTGVRRTADGGGAVLSVSNNGSLLFVPGPVEGRATSLRTLTLARRDSKPEPLALPPRSYRRPRVSADGRRLAVGIDEGTASEVWIYDLSATSAIRRLTFGGRNQFPVWSADGRRVAFQSDRDGTPSIYAQAADGGGAAERLTTAAPGVSHTPDSWSPDGRTLLFSEQKADSYSLMALSISDQRAVAFGGVQSLQPLEAVFSPDGRWVAYAATQVTGGVLSADRGIFVQPFPAAGATYQAPKTRLDFHPTWAPSGREIFYVSTITTGELTAVSVQTQPSLTFGPPATVPGGRQPGFTGDQSRGYDVLPDGRFITLLAADNASNGGTASEMRIVLNWFEELKRLVPTK